MLKTQQKSSIHITKGGKKLKNTIALCLCVLTLFLTVAACSNQTVNGNTSNSAPVDLSKTESVTQSAATGSSLFFMLENLPKLPEFTPETEKFERFYPEYTNEFKPGKNYGKLVPFLAGNKNFFMDGYEQSRSSDESAFSNVITYQRYGLMTSDGKIVVDAIYENVTVDSLKDGKIIYQMGRNIMRKNDYSMSDYHVTVIPQDGSWQIEANGYAQCFDDRIVITKFSDNIDGSQCLSLVYDTNGKLLFSLPEGHRISTYSEEIFIVEHNLEDSSNECYCTDKNGKRMFDLGGYANEFQNGCIAVRKDTLCGIIDKTGKWLFKPIYKEVRLLGDNYFVLENSLVCRIYDRSENLIASMSTSECSAYDLFVLDDNTIIRSHDNGNGDFTYFNALSGKQIVCSDTGEPAKSTDYHKYFSHSDSKKIMRIFDINGKTIITAKGGEYYERENGVITVTLGSDYKTTGCKCYLESTGEEIISFTCKSKRDYAGVQYFGADSKYLLFYATVDGKNIRSIYDLKLNRFIFENCDYAEIFKLGSEYYFSALKSNMASTYDENLNEIIRLKNTEID